MSRVLIADDSATQREVLTNILREHHFEVHTACDGLEAIALTAKLKPRVVILDVEMPKMNGFKVCRHLRENCSNELLIIICSTMNGSVGSHWAFKNGANGFIPKLEVNDGRSTNLIKLIDSLIQERSSG